MTATSPIDDASSGAETPTETEPVLLTDTVQVTIPIDDVAEPTTISATSSGTIAEDAAGGTKVADIIISGDEDSFTIDENSGEVTFAASTTPDNDIKASYNFTVIATSGDLTDSEDITITVADVI